MTFDENDSPEEERPHEVSKNRPSKFPPGSFPLISVTQQTQHYIEMLIAASMFMEEANTPHSIESAYFMLGRARGNLTRYIGELEYLLAEVYNFPLPPRSVHVRF